ncbi:MAG TPA: T9SS type A sorting domain-containing protein [Agriterribacter sp.]|nr:T9SS type A sorting domain-containing protein [Chitinophagaceae bacterium]HRP34111.1 T9SS type A sorting domain-containing protein [Agriterribacter sp.]
MLIKILIPLFLLFSFQTIAQEIPAGSCGLLMTYDAAGNRIKREYYCNNGSNRISSPELAKQQEAASTGFEEVDALYPNPTTGKVYITFSKPLDNAVIQILDVNGKVIQKVKGRGTRLEFDLSGQPGGTYFILIKSNGVVINKKVVKQ